MADDQVKYSDLISEDVVKGFELLNQVMKDLQSTMASLKTEATNVGSVIKGMGSANREQQQEIARLSAELDKLRKQIKSTSDDEKKVNEIKRQYKKLTDDQIARVDKLATALEGLKTADEAQRKHALARINLINVENMSYNELQATYNALKNSLNAMTVAERQNTEAGKAMTAQSDKIYDTMNELQKATGKYTLQVGKYRAAFDGLGYSFQQILREAPSALNLNQFFLAISNNVPQFIDQLRAFNDEQKAIKENLSQMTEGTKEYAEQMGKVMTVGQKLAKTLLSWQTLVLVGLLIIRNWEKIVNLVSKLFKKVEDGYNSLVRMRQVINEIDANVERSISKTVLELGELNNRLSDVTEGSKEWLDITGRIREIIGENYDLTGKMPGQIQQITQAYITQAEQLAKNKFVIEKIAENAENSFKRQQVIEAVLKGDVESAAKRLGYEKDSDQYKALVKVASSTMPLPSMTDPNEKVWEVVDGKPRRVGYDKFMTEMMNSFLDKELGRLFSNKELEDLWNKYYVPMKENSGKNGEKEAKDQVADLLTLRRELEDAIIANIEDEFEREEAAEIARHNRFVEDKEKELELVKGDAERTAVINQQIEEERNTHDNNMLDIDEKYRQQIIKHIEDQKKSEEQAAKEAENAAKDGAKAELKAMVDGWQKQRAELVKEGASRREIVEAEVAAEIARLNLMLKLNRDVNGEMMSDEQRQKVEEWIALLERLQQTGNYGDYKPGQFMGKGGANVSNERKRYSSVTEILFPEMDNNQISDINTVFDQAKAALNSWMDARKAAADQAKELADDEVSAAENALNREIELRNQGYANDVALKERELADAKARQKQAAEMQKKAEEDSLKVNTAMEASSMAVAVANLFKDFSLPVAIPLTAVLLGSFAVAKLKAIQAAKARTYGEGGYEFLEGGSHQSGHDINLGIGPDGSNLRAEGGEYFAVINKRNSRKYGSEIPGIVNALNSGMFEEKYIKTSDATGLMGRMGVVGNVGESVDLSAVESGVSELVRQGERSWSVEGGYRVMRYKNLTRRVRIG